MTNVNDQIQEIIKKRSAIMEKIGPEQKKWDGYSVLANKLKADVGELRRSLIGAKKTIDDDKDAQKEDGVIDNLNSLLEKVDSLFSGAMSQLQDKCRRAKEKLKKLEERCNRNTLNISVAGIGRSGKSTALKSLLDLPQNDNSVIPSGGIGALTAGKSILVSVISKGEEKTEVEFHSQESFMTQVVEPFLKVIYSGDSDCSDFDDFLSLDLGKIQKQLYDEDSDANQTRIAYAVKLSEIQDNIKLVKDKLTGDTITIPINKTGKYVSYQKNEPNICYAVRQVKIYCVFHNNEIKSLQLIDLPGLGTCSESERRCFTDGFNYSVDMALMFQRPEGITKNFPTPDDLKVWDILNKTFGKNWKDCAFLFHNNGGLLPEVSEDVASNIQKQIDIWKAEDGKTVPLVCGDAMNKKFMQEELLPSVLKCMMEKLPGFDANLFNTLQNDLNTLEEEFKQKCSELCESIKPDKNKYSFSDDSTKAVHWKDDLKNKILISTDPYLSSDYSNDPEIRKTIFNSIDEKTDEIRAFFNERYSQENEKQFNEFHSKVKHDELCSSLVGEELQIMRIVISEYYSILNSNHQTIIQNMQKGIYQCIQESAGALLPPDGNLDDIIDKFKELYDDKGRGNLTVQTFTNLKDLSAPFYTILYPELRREVFQTDKDAVQELTNQLQPYLGSYKDFNSENERITERTGICLSFLKNIVNEWIVKSQELLKRHFAITGIVQAAVERFVDNTTRNKAADDELLLFYDKYKAEIENNQDSWKRTIGELLDKISEELK